ncbi:hypothetical protein H0H93_001136 [Arthromyces matolae]|nr:hypothetical protein H0H93_001136 [Arthromyces matolae]
MSSIMNLYKRISKANNPPSVIPAPDSRPLKIGMLGAALIGPLAVVGPARNHPETVLYAVAARDQAKAKEFAEKHGIEKVYGGPNGYQGGYVELCILASVLRIFQCEELLNDPEVDVIYNPLPNGLHYEWTLKALHAGKHVLLEKPSADTAEETREMFNLAEKKGLVLLEAFHYRFHPAIQRVKAIISSGELGAVKHISAALTLPRLMGVPTTDIRYNYALGGGSLMDMGCYTVSVLRYLASSEPISVLSAEHALYVPPGSPPSFKPTIDRSTTASLAFPNDVTASLKCDLATPPKFGFIPTMPEVIVTVTLEGGEIELFNFVVPTLYHSLKVTPKSGNGNKKGKARVEKVYTFKDGGMDGKGEDWWTTYRYQFEAFVDRLKGRTPQTWVDKEDSIANIYWIEQIYAKTGLGSRPKSDFALPQSD